MISLPVCVFLTVFEENPDPGHQEMRTKCKRLWKHGSASSLLLYRGYATRKQTVKVHPFLEITSEGEIPIFPLFTL
jgi:hypothetical protein